MKRLIVLELADDATATECGACRFRTIDSGTYGSGYPICRAYPEETLDIRDRKVLRTESCIASEQRAERMVEIDTLADGIRKVIADAYRRGLREAIEVAKEHIGSGDYVGSIDWSAVDVEIKKRTTR